jgi:hypothetical protein
VLQAVALALDGGAGARLTGSLACAMSRSTLVRLIRAAADPDQELRWCWGEDFALRKRRVYGTVLVGDAASGQRSRDLRPQYGPGWT